MSPAQPKRRVFPRKLHWRRFYTRDEVHRPGTGCEDASQDGNKMTESTGGFCERREKNGNNKKIEKNKRRKL